MTSDTISFRCLDFKVSDYRSDTFNIDIYGLDENRKTYCLNVLNYSPFFYIKIGSNWLKSNVSAFIENMKEENDSNYSLIKSLKDDIVSIDVVKYKTLYNFDDNKYHKFAKITCKNMNLFYKIKNLYYDKEIQKLHSEKRIPEIKPGVKYMGTITELYETMIPPLLRFFHIKEISPSGWIEINNYDIHSSNDKRVNIELSCDYQDIIGLPEKETLVPYKICSFDIEASSSHGDFPNAKKNYKKVAYDIINYLLLNGDELEECGLEKLLYYLLRSIFNFSEDFQIDKCYLKTFYNVDNFEEDFKMLMKHKIKLSEENMNNDENIIDDYLTSNEEGSTISIYENENIDEKKSINKTKVSNKIKKTPLCSVPDLFSSNKYSLEEKNVYLTSAFDHIFPKIEGDYVTFIGSTFVNCGEEESYLNNCKCLGATTNINKDNQQIECYESERELLISWSKLIQEEDPDIIIGYNIFGFDYPFMYNRAEENDCVEEFMKVSRNNLNDNIDLLDTKIILASGPFDLKYPDMEGRLQIDVFTYMRKEFILSSYKLDYVSSYLISDKIFKYENIKETNTCRIHTKNTKGISINSYVHFEILSHSNDFYENGKKFKVITIGKEGFVIEGQLNGVENCKIKWGLAKDDVTPQDIFRMTNEGPDEKGIIAKYCIQDCNLVHQIFQKVDIMTTYIEMSKLCSVPISFLMLRGQGIKLTSYVAKKCREMDTLMPLISIGNKYDLYEGAIVLEPKTGLYLDDPVACVDYSSLYPSSIISENISHDSKVWTKTYDLNDKLLKQTGIVNRSGLFKYDNLKKYKYVDVKYDTFSFKRLGGEKSKPSKVLTGYKICRYAQFPNNGKAVLPSILDELINARKSTKKQMAKESDPFMKNILDKRQLSIKITANSVYGQCGAKTSTFYEMDAAASTTAIGRKLLIYAKDIIENVYYDKKIQSKYGEITSYAEYVYGDTDSVFFKFNFKDSHGNKIIGKKALELTIETAKEVGKIATNNLKYPHDLEYEKTFWPFCLLSKKRYLGHLFEEDIDNYKVKSMGIVLKRRDNAPIVKDIYGGIIDIIMKDRDIEKSIKFLEDMLNKLINKKIDIDKLTITKSLRGYYKFPERIAHKVLADRIGLRDPGNKPRPGDRIPFVYISSDKKKDLQGNKIELPNYIKENNLNIDYGFYITNQIMKPILQLYSLIIFDIKKYNCKSLKLKINTLKQNEEDKNKLIKKIQTIKEKEIEKLIFTNYTRINNNNNKKNTMITSFFSKRG